MQFIATAPGAQSQPLRGLVFVPARRQAQLTAIDLVTFAAADGTPELFRRGRGSAATLDAALAEAGVVDGSALAMCLRAGVGFMHEGTPATERALIERLYGSGALAVVVAAVACAPGMSVSAWGGHVVVVQVRRGWVHHSTAHE